MFQSIKWPEFRVNLTKSLTEIVQLYGHWPDFFAFHLCSCKAGRFSTLLSAGKGWFWVMFVSKGKKWLSPTFRSRYHNLCSHVAGTFGLVCFSGSAKIGWFHFKFRLKATQNQGFPIEKLSTFTTYVWPEILTLLAAGMCWVFVFDFQIKQFERLQS